MEHSKNPNSPKAVLKMPPGGLFSDSPIQSVRSFLDFITFGGLVALCIYVCFIFGMVWYFIQNNTSLVENLKNSDPRAKRCNVQVPSKPALSHIQVFNYITDEDLMRPTVKSMLRVFFPIVDMQKRSLDVLHK